MDPAELLIDLLAFFPRTPQEAWEAAIARELIPQAWAEDPRHGFECIFCAPRRTLPALADCGICRGERIVPYPQYAALFEAVLRNVAAFQQAELLAFEVPYAVNRLYAGCGPPTTVPTLESVTWAYNPFLGLKVPSAIPQVQLDVKSAPVVALARHLKALWSSEAEDLRVFHGLEAETELVTGVASVWEPDPKSGVLYRRQWRHGGGWVLEHVRGDGEIWYNHPSTRAWMNENKLAPLAEILRLGARFGFWEGKNPVGGEIALTPRQKAGAVLVWGGHGT